MGEESQSGKLELSAKERITKPFAVLVFGLLNWGESSEVYFNVAVGVNDDNKIKKIRKYFYAAFAHRTWQYVPLLITVLTVVLLANNTILPSLNVQAYGLAIDVFGASIVARGLFRGLSGLQRETTTRDRSIGHGGTFGVTPDTDIRTVYLPESLSSTARDTMDGVYGTSFLLLGFITQFIAVTGVV